MNPNTTLSPPQHTVTLIAYSASNLGDLGCSTAKQNRNFLFPVVEASGVTRTDEFSTISGFTAFVHVT